MSNDGKMEKSFVSFKAAHPEWMPADPTGSLYLSRIADLSARRTADDQTPRPSAASIIIPPADRTREYERALQESQSAAVRRRGAGSGFGVAASTMLGQSVYQSGMAQSIALGDSDGSIALERLQAPTQATATYGPMSIPSGSGELAADSEGDVRSALGESYVDGARRNARGGVGRSMQEEEEELGADGGVLGLLTQIYNGTTGGGPRGVLQR
jgi:autophagy-related protein 9